MGSAIESGGGGGGCSYGMVTNREVEREQKAARRKMIKDGSAESHRVAKDARETLERVPGDVENAGESIHVSR